MSICWKPTRGLIIPPQDKECDAGSGQMEPCLGVVVFAFGGHVRREVINVGAVSFHWRQVNVFCIVNEGEIESLAAHCKNDHSSSEDDTLKIIMKIQAYQTVVAPWGSNTGTGPVFVCSRSISS